MTKTEKRRREWRKLVAWLKQEFPPGKPVQVRTANHCPKDALGWTVDHGDFYRILILRPFEDWKTYNLQVDTLLHEWAHLFEMSHNRRWGQVYGKIHSAWERWRNDDDD